VDIAKVSLDDFVGRIGTHFNVSGCSLFRLIAADMGVSSLSRDSLMTYDNGRKSWRQEIPLISPDTDNTFTIASCQFALHYMFQTRHRAQHFFSEISRLLAPGGVFIATTMDSRVVADMAMAHISGVSMCQPNDVSESVVDMTHSSPSLNVYAQSSSDLPDNEKSILMRMEFTPDMWNRLIENQSSANVTNTSKDPFGIRYNFTLLDKPQPVNNRSNDASAVDAPEWLVPLGEPLRSLAGEYDFDVIECKNFQDYVHDNMNNLPLRYVCPNAFYLHMYFYISIIMALI
jgi:hypothetical protein